MKELSMVAGGREFTLRYTVQVICDAEEKYGSINTLQKRMGGDDKPMEAALDMMAYMANAGEKHAGRKADFTAEWFKQNLSPKQLNDARVLTQRAMLVGMHRECAEDEDVAVDAVLEEIRKKKVESKTKNQPAEG